MKKTLQTGTVVESWGYNSMIYDGLSIGVFDRTTGGIKTIVSVESVDSADGVIDRIVINRERAEKYGFKIVTESEENADKKRTLKDFWREHTGIVADFFSKNGVNIDDLQYPIGTEVLEERETSPGYFQVILNV